MDDVHISSTSNPRFKHARALLRRRARRQHAQLLLEGVRLIEDSMSAGYPPALFFYVPALEDHPLVGEARASGAQMLSIEPALLAELSDTSTPQGVVAVAPWPEIPPGRGGVSVVVDGVRDPGNLGTLLRSAAAADADQVILLPGVTDAWSPKALRAGMGAQFRIAVRSARDFEQVSAWVGDVCYYLADAGAQTLYWDVDWREPGVLIVGGETEGGRVTAGWPGVQSVAIPMARDVESLNAATAASVILFEAVRQRLADG